ncbi:DUF6503 family protein [Roseivirga seohaensis]|uniref:DUF6503 family protein n=1 Tax=Roseivirga seohaensis TaxID=1914963 RepID=UPI003BAC733D|tara:strand:- start:837 stop:1613 length:777 start_codon:yes stop_codon:yes gene_type:complete
MAYGRIDLCKMIRVNPSVFLVLTWVMVSSSCAVNEPTAQQILDSAIQKHGYKSGEPLEIQFDFRGNHYNARISDKGDVYKRTSYKDGNELEDIVTSNTFIRRVNQKEVRMEEDSISSILAGDTRSVVYFALLPYAANREVISKHLMPSIKIKEDTYYKVEVTYGKNGGGKNFENIFVYWINQKTHTIDYLAYSYYINGGGVRFREAYNQREVNGVLFQDYINYTIDSDFPAHELDYAFQTDQLREISRIDLENVQVTR